MSTSSRNAPNRYANVVDLIDLCSPKVMVLPPQSSHCMTCLINRSSYALIDRKPDSAKLAPNRPFPG